MELMYVLMWIWIFLGGQKSGGWVCVNLVVIGGLVLGFDGWFDFCIYIFMCTTKHYKMKIFSVKYFTMKQMKHKTQLYLFYQLT